MRPFLETHTPVGMGPRNNATVPMLPVVGMFVSRARASCASFRLGPAWRAACPASSSEQPEQIKVARMALTMHKAWLVRMIEILVIARGGRAPDLERRAVEALRPWTIHPSVRRRCAILPAPWPWLGCARPACLKLLFWPSLVLF
jgi:hypothetical protein